jgi:hypothetical protein
MEREKKIKTSRITYCVYYLIVHSGSNDSVAGKGKEEKNTSMKLMSVEAAIPPGKANKPFWAHGIDLLGYSLGSKLHALLPFEEPCMPRQTRLIRSSLSFEHTQALLQVKSIPQEGQMMLMRTHIVKQVIKFHNL